MKAEWGDESGPSESATCQQRQGGAGRPHVMTVNNVGGRETRQEGKTDRLLEAAAQSGIDIDLEMVDSESAPITAKRHQCGGHQLCHGPRQLERIPFTTSDVRFIREVHGGDMHDSHRRNGLLLLAPDSRLMVAKDGTRIKMDEAPTRD